MKQIKSNRHALFVSSISSRALRRLAAALLAAVMLLAACGGKETDSTGAVQGSGSGAVASGQTTGEGGKKESAPASSDDGAGQKGSSAVSSGSSEQQTAASSAQAGAGEKTDGAASAEESSAAAKPPESKVPASGAPDAKPAAEEEVQGADEAGEVRLGASMEDAIPIPLETKNYDAAEWKKPLWFTFTTGERENINYNLFCVERTLGWRNVNMALYNEEGKYLGSVTASNTGETASIRHDRFVNPDGSVGFHPNSVYYVKIEADFSSRDWDNTEPLEFVLYMKDVEAKPRETEGISLSANLTESKGVGDALEGKFHPGTNMDDAQFIPTDIEISGTTVVGAYSWFAFTTSSAKKAQYTFAHTNRSEKGEVMMLLLDEKGRSYFGTVPAKSGAGAHSISVRTDIVSAGVQLEPDTVYYVGIGADKYTVDYSMDYTFTLHTEIFEEPAAGNGNGDGSGDGSGDGDGGSMVFETPFELNETQVRFVSNKATFFNAADAKAAVAPVAEVLLAHPGHPILIAGTTAMVGKQDSTEKLSEKRAQAVKDLLVRDFGVPESQIVTIGLGYAKDPFVRGKDIDSRGRFIESEAAKNRRVVIIDSNDPIAQKLLNR